MDLIDGQYQLFGNKLSKSNSRKVRRWQKNLKKKFNYDPDEQYTLSLVDNEYLGSIFGLKEIVRHDRGEAIQQEDAVIISTIRMGFGHYRKMIRFVQLTADCIWAFINLSISGFCLAFTLMFISWLVSCAERIF